eukprot:TRINITY_DN22667_c0_g1_i1.p1 TRINITY_DN22667_c0_g1~~TRINITY_DN22667_c0_g1_i1.p1  ORF type:complete len:389 (+),score=129.25 TRINITY_DN22667_c0_g1_i1:48-1214(+)
MAAYDPDTDASLWGDPTTLVTADALRAAAQVLRDQYAHTVLCTPLAACSLGRVLRDGDARVEIAGNAALPEGVQVWLKLESSQTTGSFKVRGIQYKMHRVLHSSEGAALRQHGVLTFSAGNAGRAVAYLAKENALRATILLPDTVPQDRIALLESLRATCRRVPGQRLLEEASQCLAAEGQTLVHPFDDYDVIAGHGSCGLELLAQLRGILGDMDPAAPVPVDEVYVCCGGGGLVSGVAAALKLCVADYFGPGAAPPKVFAVEPVGADSMHRSVACGAHSWCAVDGAKGKTATAAHGLAPPFAGKCTFRHVQEYVDGVELVTDAELKHAVRYLYHEVGVVSEVSGAAAVAAVIKKYGAAASMPKRIVCLVSGRNIDPALLRDVMEERL